MSDGFEYSREQDHDTADRQQPEAPIDREPGFAPEQPKSEKKRRPWLITIAMAVVFGLIAGSVMVGVNAAAGTIGDAGSQAAQSGAPAGGDNVALAKANDSVNAAAETTAAGAGGYTVAEVAASDMPAIVAITNKSIQEIQNYFFGGGAQQYESESSGSGIIVGQTDTELLVATNYHVVSGASTLSVAFVDNSAAEAQVKGTDPDSDLAVIAVKLSDIPADTLKAIKVITTGDSDALAVGEQVVAIGNALGYGQSVTAGYISALNREVTVDGVDRKLIQTDAAINPGNSGGALLNMKGELIGINAVKYADSAVEGMGYAIPISAAEPVLNDLMNHETRYKVAASDASYLGITCATVTSDAVSMYGMPQGAYVAEVTANGPAANGGMLKGDIIVKFDGESVTSSNALVEMLGYYAAGTTVQVTVARANNGQYAEQQLTVTLGSKADTKQS